MISIVLYGRNDSHGYNLHKRAALSINCMAEVLTHADDEILFVDYNTPDDLPTFPEAIADTLTPKARNMLRVFRVRSGLHEQRYAHQTHLKTVEPVARNVAVRRSNPNNPWILTSNTDMIFVIKDGESLSNVAQTLPSGLYCAPRFEIPETLWEDFNRLDPVAVIADLRDLGQRLHLDEIVLGSDDIRYDAPGDFQLMPRDVLFAIDAFDESMLLGWHIDSNISKRLRLKLGEVKDAQPFVAGYHCDHTRQVTLMHRHGARTNCIRTFVDNVQSSQLPSQRDTWGLAEQKIEELRLIDTGCQRTGSRRFRQTLEQVLPEPAQPPARVVYRDDSYDQTVARAPHIIPFLLDMFAAAPRHTRVAWLGMADELLELFQRCWTTHGFATAIDVIENPTGQLALLEAADCFVMNFGVPELCRAENEQMALRSFWRLISLERKRTDQGITPRRIVTVNAIHNHFERMVLKTINCNKTPFSTRLRHGYLRTDLFNYPVDWMSRMTVGSAGVRAGNAIHSNGQVGHVMFGPYEPLLAGEYAFQIHANSSSMPIIKSQESQLTLEIVANEVVHTSVVFGLIQGSQSLCLNGIVLNDEMPPYIQVRLHSDGKQPVTIDSVLVTYTRS